MIVTVKRAGTSTTLGQVKVDERGKVVEGDPVMTAVVTDVLRRYGGDLAVLNGWTNGYVKLGTSA